nr:hypothetical protein CIT39_22990 [Bradyrhizobium symbiodeficiens]
MAPAAAPLVSDCTNWIAESGTVSARTAVGGLASIVEPISAPIATEQTKGTGMAIGPKKDDMACPLWKPTRSVSAVAH